jgi:hypothetical protein
MNLRLVSEEETRLEGAGLYMFLLDGQLAPKDPLLRGLKSPLSGLPLSLVLIYESSSPKHARPGLVRLAFCRIEQESR